MKVKITAVILLAMMLTGCYGATSSAEKNDNENGITPNVISFGETEGAGDQYSYIVDKNTGVVYLQFDGHYRHALTVMLNADGTPVTAEQLGLEY